MPKSVSLKNLNPELRTRTELLLSLIPSAWVASAFRSYEDQQRLYNLYLAGKGNPANKPGTSNHEKGLAVDVNCAWQDNNLRAVKARELGLYAPHSHELWHLELNPKRKPLEVNTLATASRLIGKPAVDFDCTPSGNGYWIVDAVGGVYSFGDAQFYGSMAGKSLAAPIIKIKVHPSGNGYWLLGADGGIFAFGAAKYHETRDGKSPTRFFSVAV